MESFNHYVSDNWMLFVLLAAVGAGLLEATKFLMRWSRDSAQLEAENQLKREMVLRGMSAQEIALVLTASSLHADGTSRGANYLAELGTLLAVQKFSTPIVEGILGHFAALSPMQQATAYRSIEKMIQARVDEVRVLATVSALARAGEVTRPGVARATHQEPVTAVS